MTETIWKFPLKLQHEQEIEMPAGAKILTVALQKDIICLWALCNPDVPKQKKEIVIFGTGQPIHENLTLKYIGSVQVCNGDFAWHVFHRNVGW